MSKRLQPKVKLPGKLPAINLNAPVTPPQPPPQNSPVVGWSTEPLNQDLALHRKYIELVLKKWNASASRDCSELLEISNWKKWIASVAKSENEAELFWDSKVYNSFAETLVELMCDPYGLQGPWRHKLLCSKLSDKQMEEFLKLIEIREQREWVTLIDSDTEDEHSLLAEEPGCWDPVLKGDVTFLEDKCVLEKKKIPSPDLIFAKIDDQDNLLSKKGRKPKKNPPKPSNKIKLPNAPAIPTAHAILKRMMAADKEVSVDRPGPPRSPPQSPPSSPATRIIPCYNDDEGLEGPMDKLELETEKNEKRSDGHQVSDENYERMKKVIALKYPKPSDEAPELTPEIFEALREALDRSHFNPEEFLCEFNGLKYKVEDLAVMGDQRAWLNDRNIDFYLELIKDRSGGGGGYLKVYVFHCFFYTMLVDKDCSFDVLKEATGEEDLTEFDLVFFPVNLHDHWRLVVADFRVGSLKCYDSMGPHEKENEEVLKTILSYLKREFLRKYKKGHLVFFRCWFLENVDYESIPQQENAIDCGVFLLQFAEYLSRGEKHFDFEQKHVAYFRKKMMYETLTKRILPVKQNCLT